MLRQWYGGGGHGNAPLQAWRFAALAAAYNRSGSSPAPSCQPLAAQTVSLIALRTTLACAFFFFQAEDGIRGFHVTGDQTCALPILHVRADHVVVVNEAGTGEVQVVGLDHALRDRGVLRLVPHRLRWLWQDLQVVDVRPTARGGRRGSDRVGTGGP